LSSREPQSGNELYASTQLLMLELHSEGGARQIEILMEAELSEILLTVADIQQPVTQGRSRSAASGAHRARASSKI
jgi:hypothetical protein